MSAKLAEIIAQALNDSEFRQRLFDEPEEALRAYNLSEEEYALLRSSLLENDGPSEAEEREPRVNPWVLNTGP